jgi:hypothetical protein
MFGVKYNELDAEDKARVDSSIHQNDVWGDA